MEQKLAAFLQKESKLIEKLYSVFQQSRGINQDTRKLQENQIYWAIRGDRFDGNAYIEEALQQGAAYAVGDEVPAHLKDEERVLSVDDSILALQALAHHHRKQLRLTVVAIAGSNGKTTTKELLTRALSQKYKTHATRGNLNNHIGLPLTLLKLEAEHEIAVLELGANHFEENKLLADICQPDYGLITNAGKDHLEGYGSIEGAARANSELWLSMEEGRGKLAFINLDDKQLSPYRSSRLNEVTYSLQDSQADYYAHVDDSKGSLKLSVYHNQLPLVGINPKLIGYYNSYNILCAFVIAHKLGVNTILSKEALEVYESGSNRSQLGKEGNFTIILDAYNANPSSVQAALENLSRLSGTRIALLGDMWELGKDAQKEHQQILELLQKLGIEQAYLLGEEYDKLSSSFPNYHFFQDKAALSFTLLQNLEAGSGQRTLLLKGSRGMKMEELLNSLGDADIEELQPLANLALRMLQKA